MRLVAEHTHVLSAPEALPSVAAAAAMMHRQPSAVSIPAAWVAAAD